jgi:hypothetical protein
VTLDIDNKRVMKSLTKAHGDLRQVRRQEEGYQELQLKGTRTRHC